MAPDDDDVDVLSSSDGYVYPRRPSLRCERVALFFGAVAARAARLAVYTDANRRILGDAENIFGIRSRGDWASPEERCRQAGICLGVVSSGSLPGFSGDR